MMNNNFTAEQTERNC